ncbi:PIG-L family deacetylase [Nocardioides sp. C4-1]|uniref:PIG-L family deacetylase n=1 Tax=Nocardioides sp. C4-1 TaxID=3151851 RepID=UPI00326489F8
MTWTHDSTGTTAAAWAARPEWDDVTPLHLVGADGGPVRRLVVVAAHPDDESLGAAGLTHVAEAAGLAVDVVVATAGEGSHPRSPTHPRDVLAARRRAESEAAALAVAPRARVRHLDRCDGALADDLPGLVRELVAVVGDGRDALLVGPWRHDGHPDHDTAGEACVVAAARTGCRVLGYPVWSWHWRAPGDLPWVDLRLLPLPDDARSAKRRAIAAHTSQVSPLSDAVGDEVLLGPDLLTHFEGDEVFVEEEPADRALDDLHREHDEPWGAEQRWYERRKRALLLAALPRARYRRAWEVGCSTGALTADLAARCDAVVGTDTSPAALDRARARTSDLPAVQLLLRDAARPWDDELPPSGFDLVVVSEVGYFLSPRGLGGLATAIVDGAPHADVVLCHWRHEVVGWPMDGADVHVRLRAHLERAGLGEVGVYRDRDVELVVLGPSSSRPDPSS